MKNWSAYGETSGTDPVFLAADGVKPKNHRSCGLRHIGIGTSAPSWWFPKSGAPVILIFMGVFPAPLGPLAGESVVPLSLCGCLEQHTSKEPATAYSLLPLQ